MARKHGTDTRGGNFSDQTIQAVWNKGKTVQSDRGENLRVDSCGAGIFRGDYGDTSKVTGWEIDHILAVANGGKDDLSNLQPMQWENNRVKGDNPPGKWTCKFRTWLANLAD